MRDYIGTLSLSFQFYISTDLAVLGLVTVPPIAALGIFYGKYLKKITEKILDAWAASTQVRKLRELLVSRAVWLGRACIHSYC